MCPARIKYRDNKKNIQDMSDEATKRTSSQELFLEGMHICFCCYIYPHLLKRKKVEMHACKTINGMIKSLLFKASCYSKIVKTTLIW